MMVFGIGRLLAVALPLAIAVPAAAAMKEAEALDRYLKVCVPAALKLDGRLGEAEARQRCEASRPDEAYASAEACIQAAIGKGRAPEEARSACRLAYRPDGTPVAADGVAPGGPAAPPSGEAAAAPDTTFSALNVDDWIALATEQGYAGLTLREGYERKTTVEKVVDGTMGGVDIALTLYECDDDGECSGIAFSAFFGKQDSVDAALINRFNGNHMAHLVTLEDGTLVLKLIVYFRAGVTREFLGDAAEIFGSSIKEAIEFKP